METVAELKDTPQYFRGKQLKSPVFCRLQFSEPIK
jgi:hypothetical protein